MKLRPLFAAFRSPVSGETRRALAAAWARVPVRLRTARQFLGRQYAGCGATIGAMPRCDFACRGCYLGATANRVPAASLDEVKQQLGRIRAWLGEGGNVQLTDGELTLRPEGELIALILHARALGLVPMLMTHGDSFRRRAGLLERLMVDGGLTEVSLHIDTTQRGRRGYRAARREDELGPLRNEFAQLIRHARRRTGRRLEAATTVTVTRDNLEGVPAIMRWLVANADAFKMVSFQPVAPVGRTEAGLPGVSVEELWGAIAEGLYGDARAVARLTAHEGWLGHPACSRFVQGLVVRQLDAPPSFHPLLHPDDGRDRAAVGAWLTRFGGLTWRLDTPAVGLARFAGVLAAAPGLLLGQIALLLLRWPARLDPHHPWRLIARWLRGRARIDYLNIVSHHFMGRTELATAAGRERLALCVFKAPVGDRLVSMCELNALGLRDRYYDGLREADPRTHTESSNAVRSLHAGGEVVEQIRSSRSWPVGRRELFQPPQPEHIGNPSSNGRLQPGALAVLRTGLTPAMMAALSLGEFVARVREHRAGRRVWRFKLAQVHRYAEQTIACPDGVDVLAREVQRAVARIDVLTAQMTTVATEVDALLADLEETPYLRTIPGLGWASVAGLLAHVGAITKYRHGRQLIKLAGTNPSRRDTGQTVGRGQRMSRRGRAGLREVMYLATISCLQHNPRIRAHYDRLIQRADRPLSKMQALGACMNKLLLYAFAVMSRREAFQLDHDWLRPMSRVA